MKELIPQRKVVAGGINGALCYLIVRVLKEGFGIEVTAEDAVAILTISTFVTQYIVRNKVQTAPETTSNA